MCPPVFASERPSGHHQQNDHRDVGEGILGSHPPCPVTGMSSQPPPRAPDSLFGSSYSAFPQNHKPKISFPTFDGTNPRLWKDKCESYFEIFGVSDALKPRFVALNFTGITETWLQTAKLCGRFTSWEKLQQAVCARFDRDQYQLHMKQLDSLRQTSSVTEYHARFEELAHSILLYNPTYDDTFLVVHFLSGHKDEIRAPIALHRSKDVDTASALALLQEEEIESQRRSSCSTADSKESGKPSSKVFIAGDKNKTSYKKNDKAPTNEKWLALKEFRRENNMCFTCGEKWGKGHQCPTQVFINVIQEMMENLDVQSDSDDDDSGEDQICAVTPIPSQTDLQSPKRRRKTMRFQGFIGASSVDITGFWKC